MMSGQLFIICESHTGNTHKMAQAVAEGAREVGGVQVLLKKVSEASVEELADADAIILGAPTRNAKVAPLMGQFLKDMKRASLRGKLGAAFGSYGWSGEAVGLIRSAMISQGIRVPGVGVRAKRTPDQASLEKCRQLGMRVAASLVEGTE
jgi:flavorubredoxin